MSDNASLHFRSLKPCPGMSQVNIQADHMLHPNSKMLVEISSASGGLDQACFAPAFHWGLSPQSPIYRLLSALAMISPIRCTFSANVLKLLNSTQQNYTVRNWPNWRLGVCFFCFVLRVFNKPIVNYVCKPCSHQLIRVIYRFVSLERSLSSMTIFCNKLRLRRSRQSLSVVYKWLAEYNS